MAMSIHHILAICSGREKDGEKARGLHDHRRRNTTNLPNHCHLAFLADDAWDGAATANRNENEDNCRSTDVAATKSSK